MSLGQFKTVTRKFVPIKDESTSRFFSFLKLVNPFFLPLMLTSQWARLKHPYSYLRMLHYFVRKWVSLSQFKLVSRTFVSINYESKRIFFSFLELGNLFFLSLMFKSQIG